MYEDSEANREKEAFEEQIEQERLELEKIREQEQLEKISLEQNAQEKKASGDTEPYTLERNDAPEGWLNRGIMNVPVKELPKPEGISGEGDFKKVDIQEMRMGLERLKLMQPTLENAPESHDADYWRKVDEQLGLSPDRGFRRVYDTFYGSESIQLRKDGKTYEITTGEHRVFWAQQMGIETLPARVTEKWHGRWNGRAMHDAYEALAEDRYEDAYTEDHVKVFNREGKVTDGYIDLIFDNDRIIVDFKTDDMRKWSESNARIQAEKHGHQVSEYVKSAGAEGAKGWIVAAIEPESEAVRNAYVETLAEYDIGVEFARSGDPKDIMEAVNRCAEKMGK